MKTVLFLHGFYASGSCVPAMALVKAFENANIRILTPDLPLHPKQAIGLIRQICDKEKPDLLVGNSCGSFYAQLLSPIVGIPALLGNPHFQMSLFLKDRVGENRYKSMRRDGKQNFIIDEQLIKEFEGLETIQFNYTNPYYRDKVWGLFGEKDTLANFKNLFQAHYNQLFSFPGNHTPTEEEVKTWYVPLIEKMLLTYKKPENGIRYFKHFKGGLYKYLHTAYHAETNERMVVYQALYGNQEYWIRPELMFFEKITYNDKRINRFVEVENDLE